MDFESLVYRYKNLKLVYRILIGLSLAVAIGYYQWSSDGDELEGRMQTAQQDSEAAKNKLEMSKKKAAELPALLQKVADVGVQLERAQQHLPKHVEFDDVLAKLGGMEKELNVKMMHFQPKAEVQPNPTLNYKEIPVELTLKSDFSRIMSFYDRIVHLDQLTHIREIAFKAETGESETPGTVTATASLILFKSM